MLPKHSDISIQQEAAKLCGKYGAKAETYAAEKMQDFMERDDAKQASYWMAILHEIKRLPSTSVN